jgi:simple sugar transport system permease protein
MDERSRETGAVHRLAAAVALLSTIAAVAVPGFASLHNWLDVLSSASITGLFALGLLVVLIAGELDISFTATASIAQFLLALVLAKYDIGWTGTIAFAALTGLVLGVVNGAITTWLRAPPIITTIALLNIYGGGLILISRGEMLYDFPEFFSGTALLRIGGYPITLQVTLLVAAAIGTTLLLSASNFGRILRAAGGNREAALRLGVSGIGVNLIAYGYLGLMSGIAGLAQAQLLQAVTPGSLIGRELDVVAATVLGGVSLSGGRGTVGGTLLGVLFVALLGNVLVLSGVSPYWHQAVTGAIVLAAVAPIAWRRARPAVTEAL